jgi:hypothetical protein
MKNYSNKNREELVWKRDEMSYFVYVDFEVPEEYFSTDI